MIDRGALIVEGRPHGGYRGVHRTALDALLREKKQKSLVEKYREALIEGEGVLTDLDEAIELLVEAQERKAIVELIVFEVPQEPAAARGSLPMALEPPAENLTLLGYDIIELIEPYCSPLSSMPGGDELNEHGLLPSRASADGLALSFNNHPEVEDPLHPVRVWLYVP